MRLDASFIQTARSRAVTEVNHLYNLLAAKNQHRDAAHANKRIVAKAIIDGGEAPEEFRLEAEMNGMEPSELASIILSKPNEAGFRELERQKTMKRIENMTSIPEIEALISELNGGKPNGQ